MEPVKAQPDYPGGTVDQPQQLQLQPTYAPPMAYPVGIVTMPVPVPVPVDVDDINLSPEERIQAEVYALRIRIAAVFSFFIGLAACAALVGTYGASLVSGFCVLVTAVATCVSLSETGMRRIDTRTEECCCCQRPCLVGMHYVNVGLSIASAIVAAVVMELTASDFARVERGEKGGENEMIGLGWIVFIFALIALCASVLMGLLAVFIIVQFHYFRQVVTAHARSTTTVYSS